MNQHPLSITYVDPKTLKPNPNNARTHSNKQVAQIVASILVFSFTNPLLADEAGMLIAGHGRLAAAIELGMTEVPVITIGHLSAYQKRALMLADNKIALNSGWNLETLREELIVLSSPEIELSEVAGFETAETDILILGDTPSEASEPVDQVKEPNRSLPATTKPGDLWAVGNHRLLCGNALDSSSFDVLLEGVSADQVVTDPPYNLKVEDIGGLGKVKHPEFAEASGEMTTGQFQSFLDRAFCNMKNHSRDGAIIMAFMDWRHISQLVATGQTLELELKNICVWDKINGGMGSLYRSQHEMIAIFKSGTAPHINNVELGRHGRYRTNVWRYAGASMFRKGRLDDLATHPTVKPLALISDAIKDCSKRNDIILDPFGGSGTTLLAAERTGRQARLIEIDPYYCDATIERWRKMTGGTPQLIKNILGAEAA